MQRLYKIYRQGKLSYQQPYWLQGLNPGEFNYKLILDYERLSAEQRIQAFRVTASPMARKLAVLLAAAPVIILPIVRLIQETLLRESQQVHVAEVFLGGLLKPLSEINAETNPNYVKYEFMDGLRELLFDYFPSRYVLKLVDKVSKYGAIKVGFSVEYFADVVIIGLYDLHGNVFDCCADTYHKNSDNAPSDGSAWIDNNNQDNISPLRGGSWNCQPIHCRSANRNLVDERDAKLSDVGFRVLLLCKDLPRK